MRLELGRPVRCTDDVFGELADLVIDPITKRVTHLVVRPKHENEPDRLVPVGLVGGGDDRKQEISLTCAVEDVRRFPHVQESAYLRLGEWPADDPDWDVGTQDVLALPYYGSVGMGEYGGELDATTVTYDRVPKGEVEIRRTSAVLTADEEFLGKVDGFVVDADDQITHVVLEHGHLWGKKEITIPIGAVTKVRSDEISLSLSKDEVGDLPAVRVHRWS